MLYQNSYYLPSRCKYIFSIVAIFLSISITAQSQQRAFELVWKKVGEKTGMIDKWSDTLLIPVAYKQIGCDNNFCFAYDGTFYTIFPRQTFKQLPIKGIREIIARSPYSNFYRILIGNQLKWIDNHGNFIDSLPLEHFERRVCGTVEHVNRRIEEKNGSLFLITESGYPVYEGDTIDTTNISGYFKKSRLRFFNNGTSFNYKGHTTFYTGVSPNFFFQFKRKQIDIIELAADSGKVIIQTIIKGIDFIEGLDEAKPFSGYFAPFIYRQKKLYGYFPVNKKAVYKKLSAFSDGYAAFVYKDGRQGWLTINAVEHYNENEKLK